MALTDIEFAPNQKETEAVTAHVIWMTSGQGCDGDSVAMTSATNPSLEDIIHGIIPGMPRVVIHTPVLAYENGAEFFQAWYDAEEGKLDPFVLIVEGSISRSRPTSGSIASHPKPPQWSRPEPARPTAGFPP
jgi:hydrogenase small subunit